MQRSICHALETVIYTRKIFTAEEARAFIGERKIERFTLLDVRQPGEYESEHIPGAKLIPLPEEGGLTTQEYLAVYQPDIEVVKALIQIAEEERTHLELLSRLFEP